MNDAEQKPETAAPPQRRRLMMLTYCVAGLLGLAGLSWYVLREPGLPPVRQITCPNAISYSLNWNSLTMQERQTGLAHAKTCPQCRAEYVQRGLLAE